MAQRNLWTKEELIIAFNLYLKLPFGKIPFLSDFAF
jgi:putative restriction endonuclease